LASFAFDLAAGGMAAPVSGGAWSEFERKDRSGSGPVPVILAA
jgi:hypothetical protein